MELLRIGIAEEDEIFRRGLIEILLDENWDCIILATDGEAIGKSADSATDFDVAVVCAKVLGEMRLPCPIVCLAADLQLYGAETCHSPANVKAILPHEHLSADELVASVRAAVAGLQVESPGLSRHGDAVLDARRIGVLRLLADGADTREIARRLQLSERSIKTLVREIQLALGTSTRSQAVAEGFRLGLI
ncbi:MAG TPA: LuxR C-terminal-related transcriptional regulator [Rubrobacter sp.]|nr:LuxR C-terminal-related transcriptional regulator [Rubrobacter sp.]